MYVATVSQGYHKLPQVTIRKLAHNHTPRAHKSNMPPRRRGKAKILLSEIQRNEVNTMVLEYLSSIMLHLGNGRSTRLGLKERKKNTVKMYDYRLDVFEYFCYQIGCVESLSILHSACPESNVPSMPPTTIANFIRYKSSEKGTVLKDFVTGETVVDTSGNPILCAGGWKASTNVVQFQGAITALHEARGQIGPFIASCEACVDARNADLHSTGCFHHAGQYLFFRRGDPTKSMIMKNVVNNIVKNVLRVNHVVQGAYQLLPREVRRIRSALLSRNNIYDFQLFTVILVAIHLFLRSEEVATLDTARILPNLCQFHGNVLRILYIQVKGKSDGKWVTLKLHRKDDCPDLCPVRHLLVYIYIAQIKDGFLFPDFKKRNEPLKYTKILSHLQRVCKDLMDRNKNITLHSFRKTGYLFAEWGLAGPKNIANQENDPHRHYGLHDVMVSARHNNITTAQRYMLDARGLLQTLEVANPNARYQVPRFEVTAVLDERANQQCIDEASNSITFTTLYDCAEEFVSIMSLTNHRLNNSPTFLIEKAVQFQPHKPASERFQSFLTERLSPNDAEMARQLMSEVIRNFQSEMESTMERNNEQTDVAAEVVAPTLLQMANSSSSTAAPNDLPWRKTLKTLNGRDKLEILLLNEPNVPENRRANLTNGARVWVINCMDPILSCLQNHFNGDHQAFLAKWPLTKNYSKFSRFSCKGDPMESCNVDSS